MYAEFAGSILAGTTCRLSLFHSRRPLSHHIDGGLIDNFPALEAHWERTSGESIGATIQKAKEKLVAAGLPEAHLTIQIVDGSSNVSDDILDAAEKADAGLIIIGCKGHTNAIEYSIGSTANRVVHKAENMAVCLVP
jgi:nucleotide-binding universal stress UspA family protein